MKKKAKAIKKHRPSPRERYKLTRADNLLIKKLSTFIDVQLTENRHKVYHGFPSLGKHRPIHTGGWKLQRPEEDMLKGPVLHQIRALPLDINGKPVK